MKRFALKTSAMPEEVGPMTSRSFIHLACLMAGLLAASHALAGQSPEEEAQYDRQVNLRREQAVAGIPKLLKTYGATIGCEFAFQTSNVVPFDPETNTVPADLHNARTALHGGRTPVWPGPYVALFAIDEGCSGGSAMSRPVVAVLRWGAIDQLYVDANYSVPARATAFPASVERVFAQGRDLRFVAHELGPGDALCCASTRLEGTLTWNAKKSEWQLGR